MTTSTIVQVDPTTLDWQQYISRNPNDPPGAVRYKSVVARDDGAPGVNLVEYAPGHTDPVHHHDCGELMVILRGSILLDGVTNGPGSAIYIAADVDYAFEAGDDGATFYRIVWDE
jgi:quercetin dioxygenase-like cupin family protein